MDHQELLAGFVRMHILHHAAEGDLYGQWMMDELAHHGYEISAGTLYPMLHGMERKGYLKSHKVRLGHTYRVVNTGAREGQSGIDAACR